MVDLQYICPFNSLLIELRSILGGTSALLKRLGTASMVFTPPSVPPLSGDRNGLHENSLSIP